MLSSLFALSALVAQAAAPGLSQEMLERAYDQVTPAMCLVRYSSEVTNPNNGQVSKRDSSALGLLVSPDGLVMAHGHMVLENAQPFSITILVGWGDDEKEYDATLLQKPDDINVAFLRIEGDALPKFPYVRFAADAGLRVGSPLAVVGVLSDALDNVRSLRVAYVGAVLEKPRTTYCLDAPVSFGYVGGPVINDRGKVAGVVGFDLDANEGGELYTRSGHPLVYQAALFRKYIANPPGENVADLNAPDAWLGVYTQPLTEDLAAYWGLRDGGGLVVSTVVPGSPANGAGLMSGDVIVAFGGTPIKARLDRDVMSFTKLVRDTGPGKQVDIRILRDGEPKTISLELGARPPSSRDADEYEDEVFGLTVREITTDVRIALNLPEDVQGVIVRRVKSGGPAQLARMRPGVIILTVGDYSIGSIDDLKAAIAKLAEEKPSEVPIFARFGPATGFFRLEPRWNRE